jgi:5-methyltetrahydropteroyltriglutamate--homocysteine methyltransferase
MCWKRPARSARCRPATAGRGEGPVSLETLFLLARGSRDAGEGCGCGGGQGATALEMTKWFDTNYHYLVPRLSAGTRFRLAQNRWAEAVREGLAHKCRTRPVLLGPVSFLLLSKAEDGTRPLDLLPALLPAYAEALRGMAEAGAAWVQVDEPCLATDLPAGAGDAYALAFRALADAAPGLDLLLATYFGGLRENLPLAFSLPVSGVHLDLARDPGQLDGALDLARAEQWLSLGVVDGRNVWRADLRGALGRLQGAARRRGSAARLMVAPSCSLLHVPHSLRLETALDPALRRRLASRRRSWRRWRRWPARWTRARRRRRPRWTRATRPRRSAGPTPRGATRPWPRAWPPSRRPWSGARAPIRSAPPSSARGCACRRCP